MIKIPYFNANVNVEWCDIWEEIDGDMIPDILKRISEDFPSEFLNWLGKNGEKHLKIELDTNRDDIENINPSNYKTLERFTK